MIETIKMPKMSAIMEKGRIDKIHVKDGQPVREGDLLISITAEKTSFDLEASRDGFVKMLCREGDEMSVGTILAAIADSPGELEDLRSDREMKGETTGAGKIDEKKIRAFPAARKLAEMHSLDLSLIQGSGRDGIITREDVENAISASNLEKGQTGSGDDGEEEMLLGHVKRAMLEHMEKSRSIVQATTFMEIDMSRIKEARTRHRYSYTTFVVWAAAAALRKFPLINSTYKGEGKIGLKKSVNIGVALDRDGNLFVPVIKGADNLSLDRIDEGVNGFLEKAASGGFSMEDLSGGTFTVTNSGVFGSAFFAPVVSYPQSAILGMGGVEDKPVARDGGIKIAPVMIISLSYDHRIIEGSVAVRFNREIKTILESFSFAGS